MTAEVPTTRSFAARTRRALKVVAQTLPTSRDAIVVASFGRAGSTLVYDAVAEAMARERYGRVNDVSLKVVKDGAFDLGAQPLRRGVVYKTHDYPGILARRQNVRAIFMFGSAVDAALSAHNQRTARSEAWIREHFEHLRRPYRYDDLLREDVLGFRDQCIAWMSFDAVPVLCLRYETLWESVLPLSEFCGLDVTFPSRQPRAPKQVEPSLLETVRSIYGPIDNDLAALPDCFVAGPNFGAQMQDTGNWVETKK